MNKINFKVLISILVVSFSFMACGTDDKKQDEITKGNHFLYEGKGYVLTKGSFTSGRTPDQDGIYQVVLNLFSSELTYSQTNQKLVGKGNLASFHFYSSSKSDLSGTYTFDNNGVRDSNIFRTGLIAFNRDFDNGEKITPEEYCTGGTLKTEKLGELYDISFDCTLKNGKKVTGYYKGVVK